MKIFVTAFLLALSGFSVAQTTRTWEQSKYDEFVKGTSKGVAIRSNGTLELAPEFKALATTPSTYIWSAASNKDGDLFAAAGAPARLYRVTPEGKVTVVLSPPELQVQAVVCAPDGTIYAATSPDGKVYKIQRGTPAKPPAEAKSEPKAAKRQESIPSEAKSEIKAEPDTGYVSSVFFEPKTKYIWALALDAEGRLYVATGDKGEIYRVDRDGKGSVFFASDETHIRSLAFDQAGNLIAGSDGSGLIYRISPRGEGFVLYSAAKKEITALAVDSVGVIYAAGAGDKKGATTTPIAVVPPISSQPITSTIIGSNITTTPGTTPNLPVPGLGATGSEIYRIDTDGTPHRLWSSREDLVYSLTIDSAGRLLAGTGNKGKIIAVLSNGNYTDLLKASANQVVGFAPAPGGALYAATSNLGKILVIREATQREATFDSDVFDAKMISRWGRVEAQTKGNVELFTRAGNVDNPDRNWSPWLMLDPKTLSIASPPARFLQWRAVLRSGSPAPQVDSVRVNYLPRNIAPEIEDVNVSVGNKFSSSPRTTLEALSTAARETSSLLGSARSESAPAPTKDHGSVAVRWTARDENDDQLTYSIYYRGENERRWLLLKSGLADKFYSFDSNLMPDGTYVIKVVASDAPSHSPGDALTATRESTSFDVDNTPPQITNLVARTVGDTVRVTFNATDASSVLRRAEFSIDAGDWQFVAPVGKISDSKTENYEFTAPLPRTADDSAGSDHVVVVRVYDRADNMGMSKTLAASSAR